MSMEERGNEPLVVFEANVLDLWLRYKRTDRTQDGRVGFLIEDNYILLSPSVLGIGRCIPRGNYFECNERERILLVRGILHEWTRDGV